MLIERPTLMEQIRPFYNDGLIKVITGLRRTGKSALLRLIAQDMAKELGRPDSAFLRINFDCPADRRLLDPVFLYEHIVTAAKQAPCRLTVMLDEIQAVDNWETCVNSLRADNVCEIFVTSSTPEILSGELATHLAGRVARFHVFPFSFAEYCDARRTQSDGMNLNNHVLFREYLIRGGMPGVLNYEDETAAMQYLRDVFEGIALKDAAQRYKFRQTAALEAVYRYLLTEAGNRVSAGRIEKFLKSENMSIARDTLLEFIEAGVQSHAFVRLETRNLQGGVVRKFQTKLYPADHGFREAHFSGSNERNINQVLENIVCMELLRRGWTLSVGENKGREIDFIAEKNGEKLYVQISYLLASKDTIDREFAPLLDIKDNWPKLVLSMDPVIRSQQGIEHRNIVEFLLAR